MPPDDKHQHDATDDVDAVMRALAEPRRREILRLVAGQELAAGEIAAAFDVTRPAISQHLTVLKAAGLLAERREGTRRLYMARRDGLSELRSFVDDMWSTALAKARDLVENDDPGDHGRSSATG